MSFDNRKRKIAGLLSLLSVAGASLGASNFTSVYAITSEEYYVDGDKKPGADASELEKKTFLNTEGLDFTKVLVLKSDADSPTKWQQNIQNGKFAGQNEENALKLIDLKELVTDDPAAVRGKNDLITRLEDLRDALKKCTVDGAYGPMMAQKAGVVSKNMDYNPRGTNARTADLTVNVDPEQKKPGQDIVYFHTGNRVYATTSDILLQAQEITGEVLFVDGGTAQAPVKLHALAQECPLAANLLAMIYCKETPANRVGICEVDWLKFAHDAGKISGSYAMADQNKIGNITLAPPKNNFGENKEKESFAFNAIENEGKVYVRDQSGRITKQQRPEGVDNLYATSLSFTRKIDGETRLLESVKQTIDDNSGKLGLAVGALAAFAADESLSWAFGRYAESPSQENESGDGQEEDEWEERKY